MLDLPVIASGTSSSAGWAGTSGLHRATKSPAFGTWVNRPWGADAYAVAGAPDLPVADALELPIVERLRRISYRNEPNVVLRLACQVRPAKDLEVELNQAPVRRGR